MNTALESSIAPRNEGSLFRVVWRWHFYAGIFVAPILMVMSLTGALYIFSPEIHDAWYSDYVYASGTQRPHSLSELLTIAQSASEGREVTDIELYADQRRSIGFSVDAPEIEHGHYHLYVDPATGKVLGAVKEDPVYEVFALILLIHQQLFLGTTGRIITEVVTSWALILIVTGVYLWWPRSWKTLRGVFTPRWGAKPYTLLRDLHALTGMYLAPVTILIACTGLFYTVLWGESFQYLTKDPSAILMFDEEVEQPRPKEGLPASKDPPPSYSVDEVVRVAQKEYPGRDIFIKLPLEASRSYSVTTIDDWAHGTWGPMNLTRHESHRDTGEVSKVQHMKDDQRYWWHTWTYPLHVGSFWGMTTKILWLIAALALTAMPITGLWMWWQRRPQGRSGFPRKPNKAIPASVISVILLLSLLLPALAASLLLILAGDWAVGRYWQPSLATSETES